MNGNSNQRETAPPPPAPDWDSQINAERGATYGGSADDPRNQGVGPQPIIRSPFIGKALPGPQIRPRLGAAPTLGEAIDEWRRLPLTEQRKFGRKLERLGVVQPGAYTYMDLQQYWEEAAGETAEIFRTTGKSLTPGEFVDLNYSLSGKPGAEEKPGPERFSDTETFNNTSTNLSTKADSRAVLTDAFRAELGRDPSRKEARAFFRALRAAERSNPERSSGTRTSSGVRKTRDAKNNGTNSSTTSSTSNDSTNRGGVTPSNFAQNYVDDTFDAEQDSRNSATKYYDALLRLAGGGS